MSALALIPARGGSKRIPGKNIRDFLGKPALGRAIELSFESGVFDQVIVSTDSEKIAKVAEDYGAKAQFRDPGLADDHTGILTVVQHVLSCEAMIHLSPQTVACVLPTALLMSPMDLALAVNQVKSGNAEFVMSVGRFTYPIQRALRLRGDSIEMVSPENYSIRSQDLELHFHDAGQFYVGTHNQWIARKTVFDHPTHPLVVDDWRVQDIDHEEDWKLVELLWRLQHGSKKAPPNFLRFNELDRR